MKPWTILFILVLGSVGGYGIYMFWQSEKVPETVSIATTEAFHSVPATVCKLANDAGTIGGTLWIFHRAARFDITSIATGVPISLHIIIDHEDTGYVWKDGERSGTHGDYSAVYNKIGLSAFSIVVCSPWWVPDGGLFIIPQNVNFGGLI